MDSPGTVYCDNEYSTESEKPVPIPVLKLINLDLNLKYCVPGGDEPAAIL